ncbi:beta-glucosidase [Rhodoplanes elegans]|uniref:Beta-glucosidase n=1 Tax=Rhodoplanes elegans TaxID=29408 RepID=A0A327JZ63_9BRAD|nr:GH1 family beta-glucosidase [Rhodoplanes elegans]MBK5959880.1 beta-glucosidase [Rhodoplanes elegans]RAI30896.1 beta-glucosidase [Rhodoplanes elegans]
MSTRAPATAAAASDVPFLWGVSTSSYQIEGAASEDGKGPSIWDTYSHQPGRIVGNDTGDVACDHYHRYAEDVALMKALGVGAYRFSVAWPRVQPKGRGAVNEAGLAFYDRLIDALLEAEIEPWLCLYHWDLPQALGDLGGWANRDCAFWFADYAALIARRYGDRVKRFATFNESSVFTLFGYVMGGQAPGLADRNLFHRAIHHVNLAHGGATDVLRALVKDASLGIVHNVQPCRAATPAPDDVTAAALFDAYWNGAFADPQLLGHYPALIADLMEPWIAAGDIARICRPIDWFGLNHYSPLYMRASDDNPIGVGWGAAPDSVPRTSFGWPIEPDAFRDTLVDLSKRYRLPIYVLENGRSNPDVVDDKGEVNDPDRIAFLDAYIGAMNEARAAGADVRGYFVWSLLDNFEWSSGYSQRFGIVYVDYATGKRIPKASYRWFAELIRATASPSAAAR